jgi:hypothetical protein
MPVKNDWPCKRNHGSRAALAYAPLIAGLPISAALCGPVGPIAQLTLLDPEGSARN